MGGTDLERQLPSLPCHSSLLASTCTGYHATGRSPDLTRRGRREDCTLAQVFTASSCDGAAIHRLLHPLEVLRGAAERTSERRWRLKVKDCGKLKLSMSIPSLLLQSKTSLASPIACFLFSQFVTPRFILLRPPNLDFPFGVQAAQVSSRLALTS